MKKKLILSMLVAFGGQQMVAESFAEIAGNISSTVESKIHQYEPEIKKAISKVQGQLTKANFNKLKTAAKQAVSANERQAFNAAMQILPYAAFILNNYGNEALPVFNTALQATQTGLNTAVTFVPKAIDASSEIPVVGSEIKKYAQDVQGAIGGIQSVVNDSLSTLSTISGEFGALQSSVNSMVAFSGQTIPSNLSDAISGLKTLLDANLPAIKAAASSNKEIKKFLGILKNVQKVSNNLYGLTYYLNYYIKYATENLVGPAQGLVKEMLPLINTAITDLKLSSTIGISSSDISAIENVVNDLPSMMNKVVSLSVGIQADIGHVYAMLANL